MLSRENSEPEITNEGHNTNAKQIEEPFNSKQNDREKNYEKNIDKNSNQNRQIDATEQTVHFHEVNEQLNKNSQTSRTPRRQLPDISLVKALQNGKR